MQIDKNSDHGKVIEAFRYDLLIVFLKRLRALGDNLQFPLKEVDDVVGDLIAFRVDENKVFHFEITVAPESTKNQKVS